MPSACLLIFDLDGTLFRTETATIPAVREAFRERGLPVPSEAEVCFFFGKPAGDFHAWLHTQCPPEQAADLVAAIDRRELELIGQTGELYPRVKEVLAELRAFGQMAICSNGPQEYVERVLSAHSLAPFFDRVRCRQSERDGKADMVRELLESLGGRPAILIGDRQEDVEAARRNGIPVITAAYGYGMAEEIAPADAVAVSPSDLPRLVRRLLQVQEEVPAWR